MQLRTKGLPVNIEEIIVGRITTKITEIDQNSIFLCENEFSEIIDFKGLAILTLQKEINLNQINKVVFKIPTFSHLTNGDLVSIGTDGNINTLYRINSYHNTLLATERCNSNCLMCSQPPKDRDDILRLFLIHQKLIPLIPKNCIELGISGGEPTLMGELFFELLE